MASFCSESTAQFKTDCIYLKLNRSVNRRDSLTAVTHTCPMCHRTFRAQIGLISRIDEFTTNDELLSSSTTDKYIQASTILAMFWSKPNNWPYTTRQLCGLGGSWSRLHMEGKWPHSIHTPPTSHLHPIPHSTSSTHTTLHIYTPHHNPRPTSPIPHETHPHLITHTPHHSPHIYRTPDAVAELLERRPPLQKARISIPGRVRPMIYKIDTCRLLDMRSALLG